MSSLSKQAYRGLLVALGYRVASANEFQKALFAKQPISATLQRVIIDGMASKKRGQEVIDALQSCGHTLSAKALRRFKVMIGGYGNLDARAALKEILPLLQASCGGIMTTLMGAYASYEFIAASAITNTGSSVITGDVAIAPNDLSSITGFGTPTGGSFGSGSIVAGAGSIVGSAHGDDATAIAARAQAISALTAVNAMGGAIALSGDLSTHSPLAPGVYSYASSAGLTGALVLDAGGNPNAQWIFQIGTTLTTATSSVISVINGGQADNVIWALGTPGVSGGSATLGTSCVFLGNILASTAITVDGGAGATVNGRLLVAGNNGTGAAITIAAAVTAGH